MILNPLRWSNLMQLSYLNGIDPVDKLVQSGEDQQRREVPRPHRSPVPLVLAQIDPAVLVSAPEKLQDLQGRLHLQETLWNLSLQDLLRNEVLPGLVSDKNIFSHTHQFMKD